MVGVVWGSKYRNLLRHSLHFLPPPPKQTEKPETDKDKCRCCAMEEIPESRETMERDTEASNT